MLSFFFFFPKGFSESTHFSPRDLFFSSSLDGVRTLLEGSNVHENCNTTHEDAVLHGGISRKQMPTAMFSCTKTRKLRVATNLHIQQKYRLQLSLLTNLRPRCIPNSDSVQKTMEKGNICRDPIIPFWFIYFALYEWFL